jgi:hypothetical protein
VENWLIALALALMMAQILMPQAPYLAKTPAAT